MQYLTAAASNAAFVEDAALSAGSAKGGAAKGELVLAIFELANSFRQGWGVKKDPVAAKQVSVRLVVFGRRNWRMGVEGRVGGRVGRTGADGCSTTKPPPT